MGLLILNVDRAMLSGRQGTILRVVVAEYITSGVPIPSEFLARRYSLGVSPATIRNEMAALEEQGYIIRPYTSAGGIPSDLGYRYYVGSLLSELKISQMERRSIQRFFGQVEHEPDEWARLAVSLLTQRLRTIALATPPKATVCHFRRLDLVRLQELAVMLVLVLQEGQVKQRLIVLEGVLSDDELSSLADRLNQAYWGRAHVEIEGRTSDLNLSPLEERITRLIVEIMQAEDDRRYERYYLDGWRHLMASVDVIGSQQMLKLAKALEEKDVLDRLLGRLRDDSGITISIGEENAEEAFQGCAVILSNYGARGRTGAIGVIGPTRMAYSQAIPMIQYLSRLMSDLVENVYA